ncbi:MAG: DUF4405 domain-containing protein [Sedimentisphaerales bacterium]|nr:DUF4405 domain-containing protein [Sedimentisphaerales bacterium]
MRRSSLNFIVDLISLLDLLGLVFTAFIIRYILPPGTGGLGRSLHAGIDKEHIKAFWSMSRHEWGDVHFILAVVFVGLMILHLILHFSWIKNYVKSLFT